MSSGNSFHSDPSEHSDSDSSEELENKSVFMLELQKSAPDRCKLSDATRDNYNYSQKSSCPPGNDKLSSGPIGSSIRLTFLFSTTSTLGGRGEQKSAVVSARWSSHGKFTHLEAGISTRLGSPSTSRLCGNLWEAVHD